MTALPGEGRIPPGSPALASLIQQGESAYNQGRLDGAKQAAADVLQQDPGNGRALTLLGWVSLQRQAPQEAQGYFQKVRHPDDRAIIGLALASYRLGNVIDAYDLMKAGIQKVGPIPLMHTMTGYFALMVGRVEEAKEDLEAAIRLQPQAAVLARSLLAQIYLVQNRKETADREATQALAESPDSPLALFSMGLVQMAHFELPGAIQYLEKSLAADPFFVIAYVYLAKIWLGSEYLGRAQKTIDQALHLAPGDAQVLSLAGFIRLAYRDYSRAFELWNRAVKDDPRFGEPHLGLAIYYFRYREFSRGLEEMLTATLLDPRVAPYQTELGKALYQVRAFDRSLEVYDYAKTLDPKDPSPYFYKGIALTDLNRPGQAVQEINRSIELNDNVAMFRSRSLLDQDLAVRNYSLAKSYQQLGLNDWAYSKAVTAVNYNPQDSSAHLFLRDVILGARAGSEAPFLSSGLLFSTANIEAALYRVLSRANQATFTNLSVEGTEALGLTTAYTPMFEMPYGRAIVSGGIGAWEGSHLSQDHQALVYGGAPGMAAAAFGRFTDNRGADWPTEATVDTYHGSQRTYDIQALAKWEPTVQGTLSGFFEYGETKTTDQGSLHQAAPAPIVGPVEVGFADTAIQREQLYEMAYYHRFNPQSAFLLYYSRLEFPYHLVQTQGLSGNVDLGFGPFGFPSFPFQQQQWLSQTFDRASNNIQAQQQLRASFLGQHSLTAGFDYLTGPGVSQRENQLTLLNINTSALVPFGFPPTTSQTNSLQSDFRPPQWNYSFYLTDYWRPFKDLVVELGLFKDFNKAVTPYFQENTYTSSWNPRFGVNYQFGVGDTQQVLRAAVGRYLNTHLITQALLVPAETASFPWAIDSSSGTEIRQAGAAWESQWNAKTFTVLRLNALRVSTPTFYIDQNTGADEPMWQTWKRYQASFVLNRILVTSLGLSLGVMGKRVIPDLSYEDTDNLRAFSEFNAFVGLAYLHPQGWLAQITPLLVQQNGITAGHTADVPFVILNLTMGREFPNKSGFALVEIQNLFNRRPFYSLEPARDLEFSNQRRFLFRIAFYF
jgi:tetratricopeptide (TPR) repeat protein